MSLLLHPDAERSVKQLMRTLPQGVLLTGAPGVGLSTIARHIAGDRLEEFVMPTDKDGSIDYTNGSISISETRRIYQTTRSKSLHERVVIIDDIDRMTVQAQNAFLKLLEEPSAGLHFIVTSHRATMLLPTIHSRLQSVHISHVPESMSKSQLDAEHLPANEQSQLLFMAAGRPAEMRRLLDDVKYRQIEQQKFAAAKIFVGGTSYQKLIAVQSLKTRTEALQFITSCITIIRGTLSRSTHASLIDQLDRLLLAQDRISANGNVKLQLLRACF